MLSKNKIKYIRALELKKNRREEQAFVAEGHKLVGDLLGYFPCKLLLATSHWLDANPTVAADEIIEVTQDELTRASLQKTPQEVLAVFSQPVYDLNPEVLKNSLCLALDDVQDPGNLGTIIRLADWFGIEHIFCSAGTADVYNPKTVQATMGALARVKVHYCSLPQLIRELDGIPVYGTFLNGNTIYSEPLSAHGLIVMGNEGKGVSPEVEKLVNKKLYIPNYPQERITSESLNVAIATAVVCAEFRRRLSV
ncbi:RNA methyltransferase [Phocaeicola sp.]|uniref:TrmH family RNA methyltransferase n=1 Tax=Phocaeicola sp. TaxID=2773926 RepID=UPI0023BC8759|nr:RNA methyltransferase [Phocaeicola sp.]MDE5676575.1 RNA methyltransferase [Phocaeicola sp.]